MPLNKRPELIIDAADLRTLMENLLRAAGCGQRLARIASDVHVEADLRGIGLQGIDYMPYMINYLRKGVISATAEPTVSRSFQATALIDGRKGLGQVAAVLACDQVTEKAREFGSGTVGICNSSDIFMLGYYVERIARAGLVGMAYTAGPPLVHPYGGIDRMLSTNPLAFGIPRPGSDPLLFDMATSALSGARIRQAAYHNEQVPPCSGIGPDGAPTTDAATIRRGAISPLAGHKGYGLALCIAMLAGPLTGSALGPALEGLLTGDETAGMGHLFIAIDPSIFRDRHEFLQAVEDYILRIKQSRKSPGVQTIRIPGERAFAERARRLREGVPILAATWEMVGELAYELDIEMPGSRLRTS